MEQYINNAYKLRFEYGANFTSLGFDTFPFWVGINTIDKSILKVFNRNFLFFFFFLNIIIKIMKKITLC